MDAMYLAKTFVNQYTMIKEICDKYMHCHECPFYSKENENCAFIVVDCDRPMYWNI